MVKLRTPPPLVVAWRPDTRGPLVLFHVVDFHMYQLGLSRIVGVDPHGAYAAEPAMTHRIAQLRKLLGRAFSTLEEAAGAVFQASAHMPDIPPLLSLECFVEGGLDCQLIGEKMEGFVFTPTSPGLMHTNVNITDGVSAGAGEWIAVGLLRPFVPPGMSSTEAEAELERMREKARATAEAGAPRAQRTDALAPLTPSPLALLAAPCRRNADA